MWNLYKKVPLMVEEFLCPKLTIMLLCYLAQAYKE